VEILIVLIFVIIKIKGKCKVKLSLHLTKHHAALKTYRRSGGIAPRILDLGT
jgi:hypothetical protein